ncbi:DEAD/DEAH box helicase [Sunxiuqinia dokdonensis]|uniref:Type III restriction protein res subunit n=1 Tax=Sunxiuqinia dokdonensis TaxID=1409788 RepID=A0A0L8V544_9BACT|nr:DEAD/DEAH box helicase family protein [Sunxiuqinia dokdonensis]KOH43483.1 type III restriction protein res subunit [Sunxiuqinia dokdonensis]
MNNKAQYIKQRLSLRVPLQEALDVVVHLAGKLELQKDIYLAAEIEKVKSHFPSCVDFERDFPSLCFSIATGVGKTRLMGACIAWLYLEKGIRNYFVLAPNLTIYEKLIEDFGNPNYAKYVFNGISEFVHNRPVIITGDNYNQMGSLFKDSEIRINIFNISKFNRDASAANRGKEKGMAPRIKRISEYLGESYWNYLSNLDDLVILMDEAHRYHADASKSAINELKPVLGLELTATPIDEKGNPFRNVVYEYSLAQALEDGKYVKNPAIATRKNFRPQGLSEKEVEIIKLEDAISIHQDTKNELEIYARNNKVKMVKPFILVVCRDINHSTEVFNYINSDAFFRGAFKGKVLQIDSSTRREEEIERQFVDLESLDNEIEIVIHVNMLKEGWDVNNLYTIVPLRAANASVLIEQTIGRGLRLPYNGERTGVDKVDKLTVVAHENFEKVIEAAQDPNSVLNKLSYIEIPEEDLSTKTTVVTSVTKVEKEMQEAEKRIDAIQNKTRKQEARNSYDAKKLILDVISSPEIAYQTKGLKDYEKKEVQAMVIQKAIEKLETGQQSIFKEEIKTELPKVYQATLVEVRNNTIEIPRMDLVQDDVEVWFENFDLNTSRGFEFQAMDEEIIRRGLKHNEVDTIGVQQGAFSRETPVNQIISELINYPEIDYDENAELLHKLSIQAIRTIERQVEEKGVLQVLVKQYRKIIAGKIYDQMKANFKIGEPDYIEPKVLPFVRIEDWNFSALANGYKDYREVVTPAILIPKYVFRGFEKACHLEYKFDSKTEKDFSYILENDRKVQKWLRPAPNQFRIYWKNNSKQYYPDFVVETEDCIYLVETKMLDQVEVSDVISKKAAAQKYCKYATAFTTANGGKPWKYILIPHNEVTQTTGFDYFLRFIED